MPSSRRRIRVVSCIDNMRVGGTELNAVRTAERLDRNRFDLSVVCLSEEGPLRERYRSAGIPVQEFSIHSLYGAHTLQQGFRLGSYLREIGAEIVHAHDVYSNVFSAVWARLFGVPVVIASRRWWKHVPRAAHGIGNRLSYLMAHRILANSEAVAHLLTTSEHVSARRVFVIPNFVDDATFESIDQAARCRMRAELDCAEGDFVVGSISRLHPVKDLSSLLRAVHTLASRWPTLRLVLVGDGECRAPLEAEAAALGIADRVRFAGMRPQEPNLHAAFDISVCCSLSEGFPNSVVEAMAAGRPVVATNVGGIPDAVEHDRTGLLVEVGDSTRLADAIELLLNDPEKRRRFGDAGRELARERFSATRVMAKLESTYEQLVHHALGKRAS
jgi:L-malate glycosyltransferase